MWSSRSSVVNFLGRLALAVYILVTFVPLTASAEASLCRQIFTALPVSTLDQSADHWLDSARTDSENFLASLTGQLMVLDSQQFGDLPGLAKHEVQSVLGSPVEIIAPSTPPRSGAVVFVATRQGKPVAVYKIFNSDAEISREILSGRFLKRLELRHGSPPRFYKIEKVTIAGRERPAAVVEYAPDEDLEAMVRKAGEVIQGLDLGSADGSRRASQLRLEISAGLREAAQMLGELHTAPPLPSGLIPSST